MKYKHHPQTSVRVQNSNKHIQITMKYDEEMLTQIRISAFLHDKITETTNP